MNISPSRLRFTRIGIFVVLAVLVVFLGAAAKHSQFDGPPSHGYLSKAVKMAGVRVDPNLGSDSIQHFNSPVVQVSLDCTEHPALSAPLPFSPTALSLQSPPLRI